MTRTVAVAVGGYGAWPAFEWAAEEADRRHARLEVVHLCTPESPLALGPGEPPAALVEACNPPLATAVQTARGRLGADRVALLVGSGDPAIVLVKASAGVDMLVVGPDASGRLLRRVIRHSCGPVVVVRGAGPALGAPFAGHVVVGVDGSAAARAACGFAFGFADEHGLPLAAAYVSGRSHDDYFYDETTLSTHFTVEPATLELLADEVESWTLRYPRVRLRRAVMYGTVADGLIRAAAGARLLAVGDKRRGAVSRARTGDVPLAVVRRAGCPTAVVPVDRSAGEPANTFATLST